MRIVTVLGRLAVIALLPSETLTKLTDRDSTFTPWPTKLVKLLPKNFFREIVSIWFGSDKIQVGGQFSLQIFFIAAPLKRSLFPVPMNKVVVGHAPSPNLMKVQSRIGSLANNDHKVGSHRQPCHCYDHNQQKYHLFGELDHKVSRPPPSLRHHHGHDQQQMVGDQPDSVEYEKIGRSQYLGWSSARHKK